MGVSTDAYLYFGVGIYAPDNGEYLPEGAMTPEEEEDFNGEIYAWAEERLGAAGLEEVTVDSHCHSEHPMYYISTHRHTAWRGSPERIAGLEDTPKDVELLKQALAALGFDPEERAKDIGWWLASYWG